MAGLGASWVRLDLAWSPRNLGVVAALIARRKDLDRVSFETRAEDETVVAFVRQPLADRTMAMVDAALTIRSRTGVQPCDRMTHVRFGRRQAGCYPANRQSMGRSTLVECRATRSSAGGSGRSGSRGRRPASRVRGDVFCVSSSSDLCIRRRWSALGLRRAAKLPIVPIGGYASPVRARSGRPEHRPETAAILAEAQHAGSVSGGREDLTASAGAGRCSTSQDLDQRPGGAPLPQRLPPEQVRDELEFIERTAMAPNAVAFGIALRASDPPSGTARLFQIGWKSRSAGFGSLSERRANGAWATAERRRRSWSPMPSRRSTSTGSVCWSTSVNPRGKRCYERVGFHEEGVLRQCQYGEGRHWDAVTVAILREAWER